LYLRRDLNDYIHVFHVLYVLLYCSMLYNLEFGREMDSVRAHEDAVSCLSWGTKDQVLVSGSWDCSVRVWQGMADGRRIKPSSSLIAQFDHDAHITCLSLTR
jgi:WD40 repeat protein